LNTNCKSAQLKRQKSHERIKEEEEEVEEEGNETAVPNVHKFRGVVPVHKTAQALERQPAMTPVSASQVIYTAESGSDVVANL
jgi:hypothetical protein